MTGRRLRAQVAACLCGTLLSPPALAQDQEGSFALATGDGFNLRAGFEAGLQGVAYGNAFWRLGDTFAPGADYDATPSWAELYVKPYLTFGADLGGQDLYGKLSFVASFTWAPTSSIPAAARRPSWRMPMSACAAARWICPSARNPTSWAPGCCCPTAAATGSSAGR